MDYGVFFDVFTVISIHFSFIINAKRKPKIQIFGYKKSIFEKITPLAQKKYGGFGAAFAIDSRRYNASCIACAFATRKKPGYLCVH
jgi:hypothetical protein